MDEKQQPVSGLAGLPPGPELGALLATFDLAEVANADTVEVLQGWSRQLAHTQAKFMAALVEVTRSTPYSSLPPGEQPSVAESAQRQLAAGTWATAEIAAALTWTTRGAEKEVYFAADLLEKLPLVYAALSAGHIDRGKAWVFVDVLTTADLTALQIEKICKAVVPKAGSWTTGQLRSRLMRMILAVDPDYAARRYRAAVRDRGVIGYLGPDGTAVIQGFGLSPAEAAAASERLDRLADQIVRAGHPGLLPQVRADMFTGLLDGRFEGLRSEEIIAAMMADTAAVTDTNTDADTAAAAPDTPSTDRSDTGGPSATVSSPDLPTEAAPDEASPDPRALGAGASGVGTAAGRDKVADRWGGEIRVGLSTLLLRDDRPGEIPGWGPVLADIARLMTARQHGSEWRFAVTDPDGYLILAGITRRRPTTGRASNAAPVARGCRGGVVELTRARHAARRARRRRRSLRRMGRRDRRHRPPVRPPRPAHHRPRHPPARPPRPHRATPACPDPGSPLCGAGLPTPGPPLRARPHHRLRPRWADPRVQLRSAVPAPSRDEDRGWVAARATRTGPVPLDQPAGPQLLDPR